ncbi:MFS transporter [Streptomyces sp. NBC_01433]|uniref:MFS transporter n=1 Tax=Streptomyces sp. NBC_01433 TaxID=2903864 RepID=UPI00224F0BFC|nr:MFS transporter [Streptomyces sp. NBC_01433]MCX4680413.1 MFS transporter [Streptomyces sp. NBC_01433]
MSSSPPSYATVLRTRHAPSAFGAALLGRLSYGMVPLALLLAVKNTTGSYSVAGLVMALFGTASVLLSPARAALIDRYGPRRALPWMAGAYASVLVLLAQATWQPGASGPRLGALALAAGLCTPPLGPVMRTVWSRLVPDRELLRRAYSLDAVAEELLLVGGPLLVGMLVEFATPAAGVAISAGLVLTGTLALAYCPAVRDIGARPPGPDSAVVPGDGRTLLGRVGGLRHAVLMMGGVGLCLGGLDLLVVAFTEQRHQGSAVAWVLAALSAGSAVGGLVHGAVPWRLSNRVRLGVFSGALGAALIVAGLSPNVPVLVGMVAVAGLFVAPALTTAYLLADESVGNDSRTRAGAWVNTALNAGISVGTAGAGLLVGRLPLAVCFTLSAVPVLIGATVLARRTQAGRPVEVTG